VSTLLRLRPEETIMAHHRTPSRRRAALRPFWLAALLALTLPAWPFAEPPTAAARAPALPAPGASPSTDLASEFQQLETAAHALDPASPDATARLRALTERLAHAGGQLAREVAQLRAAQAAHAAAPAGIAPRAGRRSPAAPRAGSGSAAAGPATGAAGENTPSAPFFARRGLRKFHRAGCVFGERIRPEDRVGYPSAAAALAAGLEPCKVCRPE
jgi:hypothetical protein